MHPTCFQRTLSSAPKRAAGRSSCSFEITSQLSSSIVSQRSSPLASWPMLDPSDYLHPRGQRAFFIHSTSRPSLSFILHPHDHVHLCSKAACKRLLVSPTHLPVVSQRLLLPKEQLGRLVHSDVLATHIPRISATTTHSCAIMPQRLPPPKGWLTYHSTHSSSWSRSLDN